MQHSAQCACTTGVGGGEPRVGRGRSTGPSASWKCHRPPGHSHCPRLPCGTHTHCCYSRFNACSRFRPQLYCTPENSREAFLLIFLDVGHLKLPGYLHNSKASGQGGCGVSTCTAEWPSSACTTSGRRVAAAAAGATPHLVLLRPDRPVGLNGGGRCCGHSSTDQRQEEQGPHSVPLGQVTQAQARGSRRLPADLSNAVCMECQSAGDHKLSNLFHRAPASLARSCMMNVCCWGDGCIIVVCVDW